jgi:hypothetical protein
MDLHLVRIPQNGIGAVGARLRGYAAEADMGCAWSIDENTVGKRSTFTTFIHGPRPEEAPYG